MKRSRAAALARRRALAMFMAMSVIGSALAPAAPGWAGTARADAGWGTIVHSADGVLLRKEPSFGAEVLDTVPQGTTVGLRTFEHDTVYDPDGVTQWWPVSNNGEEGWVAGFYLQIAGYGSEVSEPAVESVAAPADSGLGGETPAETAVEQFQATWDDLANAIAVVAEPEGVNLRSEPSASSAAVRSLSFDTVVELRINEMDTVYMEGTRWWPVRVDGLMGWISGAYLRPAEMWQQPVTDEWTSDVESTETVGDADTWFASGSYVAASTDDGSGLNIRADGAPDAERIGIVPESDVVQVMDGPTWDPVGNPWYLITSGEVTGFVNGRYLANADQPGDAMTPAAPAKVAAQPGVASGAIGYPLASWTFTQAFGCSPYYFEPWNSAIGCNYHNGIDLAAPMNTPLAAADGGTITFSGWCDCGLGYYVKIDHGNGFETLYGHMAEPPPVVAGQAVTKGEVIGLLGSTGLSTGPHVHFIVRHMGQDVDPLGYIS